MSENQKNDWFQPFFAPKSCMFGAISPKLNLNLSCVIWNLVVQCQRDPYTYTQVIVQKLQNSFFYPPFWPLIDFWDNYAQTHTQSFHRNMEFVVQYQRDPYAYTQVIVQKLQLACFWPLFFWPLNYWYHNPQNQSQPSLCVIEHSGKISEIHSLLLK